MEKVLNCVQMKARLIAYFFPVLPSTEIEVEQIGDMFDIHVEYIDFKPIRIVRKELDELYANINEMKIVRHLSAESVCEALKRNGIEIDELDAFNVDLYEKGYSILFDTTIPYKDIKDESSTIQ